jgi:histone H2A
MQLKPTAAADSAAAPAKLAIAKSNTKKRHYNSSAGSVHRILNRIQKPRIAAGGEPTSTAKSTMYVFDSLISHVRRLILEKACRLTKGAVKNTVLSEAISSATLLVFGASLGTPAIAYGAEAVRHYVASVNDKESEKKAAAAASNGDGGAAKKSDSETKSETKSKKAHLTFPVGRTSTHMKSTCNGYRIGSTAPVFLTAVIEYLVGQVGEVCIDATLGDGRTRITPTYFRYAIETDVDLARLTVGVEVCDSAALPRIHPALVVNKKTKASPSKKRGGKKAASSKMDVDEDEEDYNEED